MVWPKLVKENRVVTMPCSTNDYFPTVLEVLGHSIPTGQIRPYDGVSLLSLIKGEMKERPRPIGFESRKQISLTDNQYKLISQDGGKSYQLYDLLADVSEKKDLSKQHPEIAKQMKSHLEAWRKSCKASSQGEDY